MYSSEIHVHVHVYLRLHCYELYSFLEFLLNHVCKNV